MTPLNLVHSSIDLSFEYYIHITYIKSIFNNTSADIKAKSDDVLLKMVIVLSEMRIA